MRFLFLFLLIVPATFAQTPTSNFTLLNCQPVKGNFLWAATTELSNFQYLEFLTSVKEQAGEIAYTAMLPDTTCWKEKIAYNEPYTLYYFRHPAYRNYPVVGVTKKQAEKYCEWLEGKLNTYYQNNPKHPVKIIDVRLPTEKEWQAAAQGGNANAIFPWDGKEIRRSDKKWAGDLRANFVRGRGDFMGIAGNLNDAADITAPITSYWPNNYGLYNMSGNVAEMVQEEGHTRGGSWGSRAPFIEIFGEDEFRGFSKPNSRIGFRYFIEIIEFKEVELEKPTVLNAKMIEKLLALVEEEEGLYISKYEVSNELYNLFLQEGNQIHASNNTLWLNQIDYARQYEHNYANLSDFKDYPVVNISYEDAKAFCNWMTLKYTTFSKRKFDQLLFDLPTEEQWEMAARGNLDLTFYPWGGPYLRNSRGSLLCNFNPVEERWILDTDTAFIIPGLTQQQIREAGRLDGFLVTCPVESYFPNNYGLYNMAGNVAEMILDKKVTKGGSWGSFQDKVRINASEPYNGPSPFVGFRFVAKTEKETSDND